MADSTTATEETQDAGAEPATGDAAPRDEVAALKTSLAEMAKQLESAEGRIGSLNKENEKHRLRAKERLEQLESQGEYKTLAEERAAKIEELTGVVTTLEGLREKAARWESFEQEETARIAEAAEKAPAYVRIGIESAGDVVTKRKILDAWVSEASHATSQDGPAPTKTAGGGAPSGQAGRPMAGTRDARAAERSTWANGTRTSAYAIPRSG